MSLQRYHGNYKPYFGKILKSSSGTTRDVKQKRTKQVLAVVIESAESKKTKSTRHRRKHRRRHGKKSDNGSEMSCSQKRLGQEFESFVRDRKENMSSNSFSEESSDKYEIDTLESPIHLMVAKSGQEENDSSSDSFGPFEQQYLFEQLTPKTKEKVMEADLNATQIEEEHTQDAIDEDRMLTEFISMFVTNSVFEEIKKNPNVHVKLEFPSDKERPWDYNYENGDLIIDAVSEIMEATDLSEMEHRDFLQSLSQKLKRKPMSASPMIEELSQKFTTLFADQQLALVNRMADKILHTELDKTFNVADEPDF